MKVALVTGGSRGIGRDIVLSLAKNGIYVIFTYHSNNDAAQFVVEEAAKEGVEVKTLQLDTTVVGTFDSFLENVRSYIDDKLGRDKIDYLINNAGTGIYKPFLETEESDFDEMVNIHFKGVYFLTQKSIPLMNDGGRIINISSGLARFSLPNSSAYASAKGAVEVFTRYLAKELAHRKIAANVVAPGAIGTDFGGGENKTNLKKRELVSNFTALGRIGEPEDVGGVVSFLCSNEARWINGQRIEVAGGIML